MTDLNINTSLTYSVPSRLEDGEISYVSYKPSGAQVFGPNDTITIKLSSNNEFLCLDRSYLKFKLTTDSVGKFHPNGAVSAISSISDSVSGLQLPIFRSFDIAQGIKLNSNTSERRAIANVCEGWVGGAIGSDTIVGGVLQAVMPVPTTLNSTEKYIPLAFMNAGHQLSYTLNPASKVVSVGSYILSEVEIVAALIQPNNDYLQEISKGMAAGGSLKIPLQLTKSITTQCSNSFQQTFNIMTGYLGSLNSISLVEKSLPFVCGDGIKSYFINLDGKRYPRNKVLTSRAEHIYQQLAGYNTKISTMGIPDVSQTFKQYSFESNGDFSAGVATANGSIEIDVEFTTIPTTLECLLNYDALLLVSQNTATLVLDV
jgi:hypothetical protein